MLFHAGTSRHADFARLRRRPLLDRFGDGAAVTVPAYSQRRSEFVSIATQEVTADAQGEHSTLKYSVKGV